MPNPNPIATNQADVLTAIVTRLRSQCSLSASQCFLSVDPEPCASIDHNLFVTVSPEDGQFDESAFIGGGSEVVIEHTWAVVTIFSGIRLDRPEHDLSFLTETARGVLTMKRKVLKALSAHVLVNGSGSPLLVDLLQPVSSPRPLNDRKKIGDVQVWFATNFLWDLQS